MDASVSKIIDIVSKIDEEREIKKKPSTPAPTPTPAPAPDRKLKSEAKELWLMYKDYKEPSKMLKAVIDNYEKDKELISLKNQVFSIVLLVMNLHRTQKVDHDAEEEKLVEQGKLLPCPVGNNPYSAASIYYRPNGFLRGSEAEIEKFVSTSILDSDKNRDLFTRELFYILSTHFEMKKKKKA